MLLLYAVFFSLLVHLLAVIDHSKCCFVAVFFTVLPSEVFPGTSVFAGGDDGEALHEREPAHEALALHDQPVK